MKTKSFFYLLLFSLMGCYKEKTPIVTPEKKFLVSEIYDYKNQLVATYEYDANNRLTKRSGTNSSTGYYSEYLFEYENEKVSNISFIDKSFPGANHNIKIFYDPSGKILKDETYRQGQLLNTRAYNYNPKGQIKSITATGKENSFYEYSDNGNIIKIKQLLTDPQTNVSTEHNRLFQYDNFQRPPFGINYVFQIELLPQFGTEAVFERNLSFNNMTLLEGGTQWIYTYNEDNLPATIETRWKDVQTMEPIMLRIKYREVK